MGLYISLLDVKNRLIGKVSFDDDGDDPNRMSAQLANLLINQAEGDVELELSPRYAAPFQTDNGAPFQNLPSRPTRQIIRTLCLNKAVMYILDTDFGRGSAINGEEYSKGLQKQYDWIVERAIGIIGKEEVDAYRQWKYPPLPGLMLNYMNTSDDGFAGQVFITGSGEGAYAAESVNDPSTTFWNASEADIVNPDGGFNPWDPNRLT
jgi:hypothetical protein